MIRALDVYTELHKTNNDKSVARATIAVNRHYKDQTVSVEADFISIWFYGAN